MAPQCRGHDAIADGRCLKSMLILCRHLRVSSLFEPSLSPRICSYTRPWRGREAEFD